jgi:hypothetical protein
MREIMRAASASACARVATVSVVALEACWAEAGKANARVLNMQQRRSAHRMIKDAVIILAPRSVPIDSRRLPLLAPTRGPLSDDPQRTVL